jgi:hypothetical protein
MADKAGKGVFKKGAGNGIKVRRVRKGNETVILCCVSSFKLLHLVPDACHQGLKFLFGQFEQEPQVTVGLEKSVDNGEQFLFGHDMPLYPKPLCLSMHFKDMVGGDYAPWSRGFSRFGFPWHKADISKVFMQLDNLWVRMDTSEVISMKSPISFQLHNLTIPSLSASSFRL